MTRKRSMADKNKVVTNHSVDSRAVHPLFILGAFAVATIFIGFAIWKSTLTPSPHDPPFIMHSVTPKKIADMGIVPPQVKTGLYINNFSSFNVTENEFIFDALVWFEFNPALISINSLSRFAFEKGEFLEKSKSESRIVDDKLVVTYKVRVKCTSNLNYRLFPFNAHTIHLMLYIPYASIGDFIFESSNRTFELDQNILLSGWNLYAKNVRTGYIVHGFDKFAAIKNREHPSVEFSMYYARSGVRDAITIIFPLLILFFVILFSFSFSEQQYDRMITFCAAIISALLVFKFVIENLSPHPGYFLVSDYLFILFLFSCLVVFFLSVIATHVRVIYKKLFIIGLLSIVVAVFFYIWVAWIA